MKRHNSQGTTRVGTQGPTNKKKQPKKTTKPRRERSGPEDDGVGAVGNHPTLSQVARCEAGEKLAIRTACKLYYWTSWREELSGPQRGPRRLDCNEETGVKKNRWAPGLFLSPNFDFHGLTDSDMQSKAKRPTLLHTHTHIL